MNIRKMRCAVNHDCEDKMDRQKFEMYANSHKIEQSVWMSEE